MTKIIILLMIKNIKIRIKLKKLYCMKNNLIRFYYQKKMNIKKSI